MKDERLFIKINKADKADINRYARSTSHRNASTLIRTYLKDYILTEQYQNRHYELLRALRKDINAIGNNLNQIARTLNAGQPVEDFSALDEWATARKCLEKALNRVRPFRSS